MDLPLASLPYLIALFGTIAEGHLPSRPLAFVENRGQFDARARFVASRQGMTAFVTEEGIRLTLSGGRPPLADAVNVFLSVEDGGGDAVVEGLEPQQTIFHYFRGADPTSWRTDVPAFAAARIRDVRPGLDLIFRDSGQSLEYDVVARRAGALEDLVLCFEGTSELTLAPDGSIVAETPLGALRWTVPRTFLATLSGERRAVPCSYRLLGGGRFAFALDAVPEEGGILVIDPGLLFASYIEGSGLDQSQDIAMDASGAAFVAGWTSSADFPTTPGAFDFTKEHLNEFDAFVAKLSPNGTSLVYATYLGGSGSSEANAIALDAAGRPVIAGTTTAPNFPTTFNVFQPSFAGSGDVFVAKLNAVGNILEYSTYLGGSGQEQSPDLAVDGAGQAYVTGLTDSANFPVTPGAYDTSIGSIDAFLSVLAPSGNAIVASTFLGGSNEEFAGAVAVEPGGSACVFGSTGSSNFPTTPGAFQTFAVSWPKYVTRFAPGLGALIYSTLFEATSSSGGFAPSAFGVALDGAGQATVAGATMNANFPVTPTAFDTTFNGGFTDGIVARFDASGSSLLFSAFLGGASYDTATAVALDGTGAPVVAGDTDSPNFPVTAGAFDTTYNGQVDGFVCRLKPDGTGPGPTYATFLGGMGLDRIEGIAVGPSDKVGVAGITYSLDFPTTLGAADAYPGQNSDVNAFVAALDLAPCSGFFEAFGSGCFGTSGFKPVLVGLGCPKGGEVVGLRATGGMGGSSALFLFGLGQGTAFLNPYCPLQILPLLPIVVALPLAGTGPGNGVIEIGGALPSGIASADVYVQVGIIDATSPTGLSATNPLKIHIGP